MSLVEQALKKMQAAGATPPSTSPPHAVAVAPERVVPIVPAAPRSTRIVKIDRTALRALHVLPTTEDERRIAQEFRQIKRSLVANALGRGAPRLPNGHLIMMASALPGDGKTFTSMNLALSMALDKDVRVLLVDADVAKPHISRILNVQDETGLLDVLRDQKLDVESVILDTDVPNLSVLPAGSLSETATELLASSHMMELVARLGAMDSQRIVIFDSPPLLLTTEARALSDVVGQIVLVVNAGSTPQKAVLDALETLGEGKAIGLVLNQCEEGPREQYYQSYGEPAENKNAG